MSDLTPLLWAVITGYGVHLIYTALALGWRGARPGPRLRSRRADGDSALRRWMIHAGLAEVAPREAAAIVVALGGAGALAGWALFAGPAPALAAGSLTAGLPVAAHRRRAQDRRAVAHDSWPAMLEEVRLRTGSLGRSIPAALFEVGASAPDAMRPAFQAAQREWAVSTDLERALSTLKTHLADPTADAVCETLLVAHQVGGADLDRRLRDLIDDRAEDVRGRKDARAKQAGVRFARRFVLIVPIGMAAVGLTIGDGRAAYSSPSGQTAAVVALGLIALCWTWAGALLRLPTEERVLTR